MRPHSNSSFLVITAAGFAATVAQVLLLRELLVLFYGNEMSTAFSLAGWLLWTALGSAGAARLASSRPPSDRLLALMLALLAVSLLGLLLLARGARWLFAIPPGELAAIGTMMLVCVTLPALFCLLAGALFGLCWASRQLSPAGAAGSRALVIYLGEAVGAALGGVFFFFVLLRFTTAYTSATLVALVLLFLSGWIFWQRKASPPTRRSALLWALAAAAVLVLGIWSDHFDRLSRRWQWGSELVASRDTPFHNLALVRQADEVTLFANGLWLFTRPDPVTAELAVHVALLQHQAPSRLLFLGGGLAGQLPEALKHPSVKLIDYVEQDPELVDFASEHLGREIRSALRDLRVHLYPQDAGSYLQRETDRYDVVLLNAGDPINAQMNRFYTVELFRRLAARLLPGGILTFSVPGGGDMVGPAHARFLGSMTRTLSEVFPRVVVLPGERARFLAAVDDTNLTLDSQLLSERLGERRLDLVYLRDDTLQEVMNPMRIDYLQAILTELEGSPINRQFAPVCYYHGVMLWAAQWHPKLERALAAVTRLEPYHLLGAVLALGCLFTLGYWRGPPRYRSAVAAAVGIQGAAGMVIQLLLILGFQILEGYAYLQLALIIAFFMAGLAAGAFWIGSASARRGDAFQPRCWFLLAQVAVTVFPLLLLAFFSPAAEAWRQALSSAAISQVFTAASFAAGLLGGAHFSLAVVVSGTAGARLERAGGYLYAADLAGAAGGALAAGLFALPLLGVPRTLLLLGLLGFFCLLALLRRPE